MNESRTMSYSMEDNADDLSSYLRLDTKRFCAIFSQDKYVCISAVAKILRHFSNFYFLGIETKIRIVQFFLTVHTEVVRHKRYRNNPSKSRHNKSLVKELACAVDFDIVCARLKLYRIELSR